MVSSRGGKGPGLHSAPSWTHEGVVAHRPLSDPLCHASKDGTKRLKLNCGNSGMAGGHVHLLRGGPDCGVP